VGGGAAGGLAGNGENCRAVSNQGAVLFKGRWSRALGKGMSVKGASVKGIGQTWWIEIKARWQNGRWPEALVLLLVRGKSGDGTGWWQSGLPGGPAVSCREFFASGV